MSPWPARESADWAPDVDDLARLVTPRTRLIVVNIPHNPTGYLMTVQELATLLTFAEQRGITVLSDEVYEDLVLEGPDGPPRAASASASAVSLSGLSKNLGLPWLRVGWLAAANGAILHAVTRLRLHVNTYVSAPSEILGAVALRHSAAILARHRALARENLAALSAFLERQQAHFQWHRPRAGVVAFPRLLGPGTAADFSAAVLAQTGILEAPSPHFDGGAHHLRVGFGVRNTPAILALLERYLDQRGHDGASW